MDSREQIAFYRLASDDKRGEVRVKPFVTYDPVMLKTGILAIEEPLNVKVAEGHKFYDIMCLQDPHNFAVSERIHNLMISSSINGWRSYRLAIEGHEEQYWGIQVLGRAGSIVNREEGFVTGLSFDQSTWDGTDIFILKDTVLTIASERLRDLLVDAKATNTALTALSTFRWFSAKPDK